MIKAVALTKKYRKKVAVDNISFKVETGKVTGFLGPNGARNHPRVLADAGPLYAVPPPRR